MFNKFLLPKYKLVLFLMLLLASCEKTDIPAGMPSCLAKEIKQERAVKIWQYTYQGQVVYYMQTDCCDNFNYLYDSKCNLICAPDGGFTGQGDGKCRDFFSARTNEILLWEKE